MPAEVESMFSVRANAWHDPEGKFTLPDYPSSIEEARRLAGLEWEPEVVPAFVQRFAAVEGEELPQISYEEAPDTRLVLRTDTAAVLGHVGSGWTPVLNRTLFEFIEATLELPNTRIATAGSLAEGRNVWALVELDEPYKLSEADDSLTIPYLAVLNGHDGSAAFRALPTSIRVVCRNTYRAAELQGERSGRQFVFRHTGSVMDRIEEAKRAIRGVQDDARQAREAAADLLALPANEAAYISFLEAFIPDPAEHGEQVSSRVRNNISEARASFRAVYGSQTCAAHHGSALGLVDASIEYLDHLRGYRNRDSYLGRTLLKPEPLKAKAVKIAREVCLAG